MVSAFELRWGALYLSHTRSAWYWTATLLIRRLALAIISSLLLSSTALRCALFTAVLMSSGVAHSLARPFEDLAIHHAESVSYLLLLAISLVLTASSPPYSTAAEALLFLLTVPSAAVFLLWIARHKLKGIVQRARGGTRARKSPHANPRAASGDADPTGGVQLVEMSARHADPPMPATETL